MLRRSLCTHVGRGQGQASRTLPPSFMLRAASLLKVLLSGSPVVTLFTPPGLSTSRWPGGHCAACRRKTIQVPAPGQLASQRGGRRRTRRAVWRPPGNVGQRCRSVGERVTNAARSGADGRARSPRGGAGTARRKRGAGSTFGQRQEAWETLHPGNSAARASARACDQAPSRRARPVALPPTAFRRAWRGPPCPYPRRAPSSEPLLRPLRAPRSGLADGARRWRCCRLPASPFLP